jgi:ABC-type transport system substrate-binding protein
MTIDDRQAGTRIDRLSSANDLLQARLRGRISRRQLLQRAAALGLTAPVIGVLLNATGDAAFGALRQEATPVAVTGRTEPVGTPLEGGTLTIGIVGAIGSAAPYMVDHALNPFGAIQPAFLEGLLAFDSQQRIRPALAESYEIADDGVTYTFTLREGVVFHNGEPLTSADVVASWELIADPDLPVWTRAGWERIEAIDTPDARTVVVTTRDVYAPFLSFIAAGSQANSVIVPASMAEDDRRTFEERFNAEPVGTGAFRVESIAPDRIELERFDDYWRQGPILDRIIVRLYPDYDTQLMALSDGEIQLIGRTGDLTEPRVDRAAEIPGVIVLDYPAMTWGHLDLKQIGLLRERRVRQALDYATPTDRLIEDLRWPCRAGCRRPGPRHLGVHRDRAT